MNTKLGRKFMHVMIAVLFLFGSFTNGIASVNAATPIVASATASNTAPTVGETISVSVNIDMTASGGQVLGSYTAVLAWDPTVLSYASYIVPPDPGFAGAVNTANTSTGQISFNGADTEGATGNFTVLAVGFNVIGAGDSGLDLTFSAMSSIVPITDLLPSLVTTESSVTAVADSTAGVTLDGTASSGVGAANASSVSFSHTTGNGENRLMLVGVSWNAGTTDRAISSIIFSYDTTETVTFTEAKTQKAGTNLRYAAIYKSDSEPPINKTGTVTVTFPGTVASGIVAGAVNFQGVNQTTPLGTSNGANGSSTAASVTMTGLNGNELVFDTVFQGASSESQTLTPGAGQSNPALWNLFSGNTRAAASIEEASGSTSVVMSWTAASSSIWAIAAVPINPAITATCYALTLTSGSFGDPATPNPTNSPGCPAGQYTAGQVIGLTASPDWGWEVQAWSGTDDDSSTLETNSVTMPAAPRTVNVTYQTKACWELTLTSGPNGTAPTASPTFSLACTSGNGWYVEGEEIALTAHPDSGYKVDTWSGTDDDALKTLTNAVTMPAAGRTVNITYAELPPLVSLDGAFSSSTADDVDSISVSHTTGTGANRLILVGVSWNCGNTDRTISSVTFTPDEGTVVGLSEVITQLGYNTSNPRYSAIYSLVNPPTEQAGTITITFSGSVSNGIMAGAANFAGVDQTTPLGKPVGTNGNSLTPSVELTMLGGSELVFDNVFLGASSTSYVLTAGAGQTQLWNPAYIANLRASASIEQAEGSSVTMSWDAGTANYWAIAAVPINPVSVSPSHTVSFNANGGTGSMAPQVANVPTALTLNTFTRPSYNFAGWNTQADGLGTAYSDGATYDFLADITLYAQWSTLPNHTVTFNANGGTGSMTPQVANTPTALTLNTFTRAGYYFTGWNTAANDSGVPYADGANYDFAVDITLYAQWMALPTYTVTFNNNGGTGSMTQQFANVPTALTLNTFTREGYAFNNWNTQANGLGTAYANGATYSFAADITLYAQWTIVNHTVTFNANGGTGTMAPQTTNLPANLTSNTFTRTGYNFSGWNTVAGGGGIAYADGATYSFIADVTLYAQWTALPSHTVIFNANGGSGAMSAQVSNVPAALTLNAFTRSGYNFTGWNTQSEGLGTAYTNGATYDFTSDVTLYAQWLLVPTGIVSLDGTASSGTANNASTISFAHTTGTGINRLLLVGVSWNAGTSAKTISSVKFSYGSGPTELSFAEVITEPITLTGSPSGVRYAAIYRSTGEPPEGQTGTVTITFSTSVTNGIVAGAVNFQGVDQATPLGTADGAHASAAASNPTLTLTGLSGNELVFDTVFLGASNSTYTLTADAGQSEYWNGFVGNTRGTASTKQATSSSVTMSWTPDTQNWWTQVAVPINPATGGTTYELTIAANPTGGGTTIPSVGPHTYAEDTIVNVTATANPGYAFANWSGDCSGTDPNLCSVTMTNAKSVTANFTALTYTLTANVVGSGSITKNPNASSYSYNTDVELTAVPASGWLFEGWSGALSGKVNPQTITMDDNKSVTATFTQMQAGKVYLDGEVSSEVANNVSSIQFPHTTGTGSDRFMLIGVSWNAGDAAKTISSVVFSYGSGPTSLTFSPVITETVTVFGTASGPRYAAIYRCPSQPPAGTSGTITITFSATIANGIVAGAVNFQNVDQITPLGTPVGAHASVAASSPSLTLMDLVGDELVFDTVFLGGADDSYDLTPDAGQSLQWNQFSQNTRGVASIEQAASPVTMSWTPTDQQNWWAQVAVPIKPVYVNPSFTVTFDPNGGTGSMAPQVSNAPTALSANAFTRTNYIFIGWNTASDGTGTAYANGAIYSFAANVTLYAQWQASEPMPETIKIYLPLIGK